MNMHLALILIVGVGIVLAYLWTRSCQAERMRWYADQEELLRRCGIAMRLRNVEQDLAALKQQVALLSGNN